MTHPTPSLFTLPPASCPNEQTSREAEARHAGARTVNIRIVTELVKAYPGKTSLELYQRAFTMTRHEIARRLPDAEKCGLVRRGPARPCTAGRGIAVTWWPANAMEGVQS